MDPNTRALMMGAAGAGGAEKIYVEDVFSTWLYTGNSSTQTITNGIDLAGKGGLVWAKSRTDAAGHSLIDTTRGFRYQLRSNSNTSQEDLSTNPSFQAITAFNTTGFDLGADGFTTSVNRSGQNYASWTFRKAKKFFDVVTYTGNATGFTGSLGIQTISHSLGATPGLILIKRTNSTSDWHVWHRDQVGKVGYLNLTNSFATDPRFFDNSSHTSTTFTVGDHVSGNGSYGLPYGYGTNENGATYVAYVFAHNAGGFGDAGADSVVKCGSYTGNGSTTGPVVDLSWEPQWLLIKRTDSIGDWQLIDNMRGFVVGGTDAELNPNLSNAESTGTFVTPLATGFQLNTTNTGYNASGGTYIYIAIRRGPMKTPTVGTQVFKAESYSGLSYIANPGFPPDLAFYRPTTDEDGSYNGARLLGNTKRLRTVNSDAELTSAGAWKFDATTNTFSQGFYASSGDQVLHMFRRAPGFFDVVAYTGTGAIRTVSHNLGVAPELMIVKVRSAGGWQWAVYVASLGATKFLNLNGIGGATTNDTYWYSNPTSLVFNTGDNSRTNLDGGTLIAYLFASCPGVSKVFSFTGTGTTLQINCGFTSGARLVLIKRTDSTGDWYIWDSARGIISGNDPYLLLNSTAAEVTNTDYIDPYSAGFEISSTAPAAINANGGSYIGLAIA